MPPLIPANDALWRCLCPSFATSTTRITTNSRLFVRQTSKRCAGGSGLALHQNKPPIRAWLIQRSLYTPIRSGQRKLLQTWQGPINDQVESIVSLRKVPTRGTIGTLRKVPTEGTTGTLKKVSVPVKGSQSEALREASKEGDYVRVYEIVKARGDKGLEPNTRLYTALLLANTNAEHGSAKEVSRLLDEMIEEGVEPDSVIYHAALKVLAIHPDYVLRNEILDQLQARWFTLKDDGWNDIVVGLLRERQVELALDKLEQMHNEGIKVQPWLQDLIIYMLCDLEEFDEALRFIRYRSNSEESDISGSLWAYILDAASRSLHYGMTLYAWRKRVDTKYLNPPSGICINVLNIATRHGDIQLATSAFRILGGRSNALSLHHYEAVLESYLNASDLRSAMTVLTIMITAGVQPEDATTRPLYLYIRESRSRVKEALEVLKDLKRENTAERSIPTVAINGIIEASMYQGDISSAFETYKILHTLCTAGPTTTTFNILFRGYPDTPPKKLAMFLASEMLALKIRPNALTYDRLILVCAGGGDQEDCEDAFKYLEEMKANGWWPRRGTLLVLVKRCVKEGDERVFDLMEEMEDRKMAITEIQRWVGIQWGKEQQQETMKVEGVEERKGGDEDEWLS